MLHTAPASTVPCVTSPYQPRVSPARPQSGAPSVNGASHLFVLGVRPRPDGLHVHVRQTPRPSPPDRSGPIHRLYSPKRLDPVRELERVPGRLDDDRFHP